ncbi:hypothetical protein EASAB2608_08104 [Streptomyces sp. EAS-AB2608]|nr:hypothetical protein EASAB2608_08104 [Streptomyces sp. EAS-AB2608]
MGLDGVDVGRGESGGGQRGADDPLLGGAVGGGQAVGGAVGVDGGAADQGEHPVAVAARVGEALDDEHAGALAPAGAVGRGGEGLAAAVGGQPALPGEVDEGVRRRHDGDTADQREVALALPQRLGRQVQRDQRGGAGGVDGDGRALQAEGVGDPAGDDAAEAAVAEVGGEVLGDLGEPAAVVVVHDAREDAGAGAAQPVRVDGGALQRLPGHLQQQPLLRVHGGGLAGADAEEGGVELGGVVQEGALAGVGAAGGARLGVVQRLGVPAAVRGEAADRVDAVGDEPPQVLRGADPAGVAAAHADDGDRVVVRCGAAGGRGGVLRAGAEERVADVVGEGAGGGVVEDEGGGQPQSGGGGEPVAQFDGGQGVEAEVGEGPAGVDGGRPVVPEHGRHLGAHQVEQGAVAVGGGQRGELSVRGRRGGGARGGPAGGRADEGGEQRRYAVGAAAYGGGVDLHRYRAGCAGADGGVEQLQGTGRGQAGDALGRDAPAGGVVQCRAHAAVSVPQPPGERGGRQAEGGAVLGEGVEVGVGGGVVALAGAVEDGGEGGEQHEAGEVAVSGQFVQVPGAERLGVEDLVHQGVGEGVDDAVADGARRVHDGVDGVLGEQPAHRLAVTDVAGGHRHLGAERGEFGVQCGCRAAAADEQQAAHAVGADQVPGEQRAETAGAAGDEDRAPVGGGFLPGRLGGQPGHAEPAVREGEFGFAGGEEVAQVGVGGQLLVLDEDVPAGVLRLGGADQAADGRVGGAAGRGDDHEPGAGQALVRLPGAQQPQHVADVGARGAGVGVRRAGHAVHDGVRGGAVEQGVDGVGRVRQDGGAQGWRGGRRAGVRRPPHGVQDVARRYGAGGQGLDVGHRGAGGVGEAQGDGVAAAPADPDAEGGRAGGVQGDAGPGERDEHLGARRGVEVGGVQRGVEQRRVQAEPGRVGGGLGGQGDLGVDVVTVPPGGAQPLEGGAVSVALVGEVRVDAGGVERLGVPGRPHGIAGRGGGGGGGGGEDAGGVLGPGVGLTRAGVDRDGAAAGLVGFAHGDLDGDVVVRAQDQRGAEGQLLQGVRADVVAGAQGEFDEGGAGEQQAAGDDVVGEPGLGPGGQAPGQDDALGSDGDHGGQQRVAGGELAESRGVGGGALLQPEAPPLERVAGQVDAAPAQAGEVPVPVDGDAAGVGGGERGEGLAGFGALAPQHRQEGGAGRVGAVRAHGGQHRVGADLQEGPYPGVGEGADGVVEADPGADVLHPVLGVAQLGGDGSAGDGGDHRQRRLGVVQHVRDAPERGQHGFHQRRVEGVADPETFGVVAARGEFGGDALHIGRVAGDDDGGGPVDGGDAGARGEQRCHLVLGGAYGHHGAAVGELLHEPAAGGDQDRRVLEGEHAGHVRGGDLADGVPGELVRDEAPALQEPVQGDLHGEQGGLRVLGAVQQLGLGGAGLGEQDVRQRPGELEVEVGADGVQGVGEGRVGGGEFAAHADALAALPGEQEAEVAVGPFGQGRGAGGQVVQRGAEFGAVGGDQDGPVGQRGPGGGQGVGEVERVRLRHEGEQVGGAGPQGCFAARGEGEGQRGPGGRHRAGGGVGVLGPRLRLRPPTRPPLRGRLRFRVPLRLRLGLRLFQDDVRVGPADPEGRHARPPGPAGVGPGALLGDEFHRPGRPVDVRGGRVDVQGRRYPPVFHGEDRLDHAGDARGGLGVPEVGLDGAEQQRGAVGAALAVGGEERGGLDGVAEPGAGAVRLHHVDVGGGETGVGEGAADQPLLGGAVGRGQTVGGAVLVDGGAAHQGQHAVAVAQGVAQPLQDEHADALGESGAVRGGGERLAAAVGREAPLPAEGGEHPGAAHHGHAAREGERGLALPQRAARQVDGDQGGGAGGVDGDRRSLGAQHVGDAAGDDAAGVPGEQVGVEPVRGVVQARPVLLHLGAEEHAGRGAAQRCGVDPGVLQGLPGGLQDEPLLRVHAERLARADAEEVGVELGGGVEESAAADVGAAGHLGVLVVEGVQVPAAVLREAGEHLAALGEQPPQVGGRGDAAGEAAADADDRDRLAGGPVTGRPGGFLRRACGLGEEPGRQVVDGRAVVGQAHRQVEPGPLGQPPVQVDRGERVESLRGERGGRVEGARRARPGRLDRLGHGRAHQFGHQPAVLGRYGRGEPPRQR